MREPRKVQRTWPAAAAREGIHEMLEREGVTVGGVVGLARVPRSGERLREENAGTHSSGSTSRVPTTSGASVTQNLSGALRHAIFLK